MKIPILLKHKVFLTYFDIITFYSIPGVPKSIFEARGRASRGPQPPGKLETQLRIGDFKWGPAGGLEPHGLLDRVQGSEWTAIPGRRFSPTSFNVFQAEAPKDVENCARLSTSFKRIEGLNTFNCFSSLERR